MEETSNQTEEVTNEEPIEEVVEENTEQQEEPKEERRPREVKIPEGFSKDDVVEGDILAKKLVKVKDPDTNEWKYVTVKEATNGFMFQKAFTKKTQELANERKAVQSYRQAAEQKLGQLDSVIEHYSNVIQNSGMDAEERTIQQQLQGINPATLDNEEFKVYSSLRMRLDDIRETKRRSHAELAELQKQQQAERQHLEAKTLEEEAKLLFEAIPDFKDKEKAPKLQKAMQDYLASIYGEEGRSMKIIDHREMMVINDAMKYRAMQKAGIKPKKVNTPVKVQRTGGAKETSSGYDQYNALLKRANMSGKSEDVRALLRSKLG